MSEDAIQLRDQVGVLRRRWLVVVATIALTVGIGLAFSLLQTPSYVATTEVQLGADPASTSSTTALTAEQVATQARAVTDFDALAAVIDTLGIADSEEDLLETVSVEPDESGAAVITISATRDDATEAAAIANALAEGYLERAQTLDLQRLDAIDDRVRAIDTRIAALNARISAGAPAPTLADLRFERRRLQAERDLLGEVRAGITESNEAGDVLRPATAPSDPASPQPLRTAGLAAVIGLMLGIGAAYLRDHFDDVVREEGDLQSSLPWIPVLGRIPRWRRLGTRQPSTMRSPAGPVSDAYRVLGLNVRTLLDGHGDHRHSTGRGRVLLVASATASEGKTTTAVNLAVVAAQAGLRVVLVDADLRRPRVGDLFGLRHQPGLVDVLDGTVTLKEALADGGPDNLLVLPAGNVTAPTPGLMGSPGRHRLLEQLATEADLVVVDGAAVLATVDALELAKDADVTVLAVRESVSRGGRLSAALLRLRQVGATVAGIVVTDVRAHRTGHG